MSDAYEIIIIYIVMVILAVVIYLVINILLILHPVCDSWHDLSPKVLDILNRDCVIIYPHESYSDFLIAMKYAAKYTEETSSLRFVVNPYLYNVLPSSIRRNAIKAPFLQSTGHGGVSKIVNRMKKEQRKADGPVQLLISPTGTTKKDAKWRSGYWWIAKELNLPIVVMGLNYDKHRVEYKGIIDSTDDKDTSECKLKAWAKSIPQRG